MSKNSNKLDKFFRSAESVKPKKTKKIKITQVVDSKQNERIPFLQQEILRHQDLYYNKIPEINDFEFDLLINRLQKLAPDNHVLKLVGKDSSKKIEKYFNILKYRFITSLTQQEIQNRLDSMKLNIGLRTTSIKSRLSSIDGHFRTLFDSQINSRTLLEVSFRDLSPIPELSDVVHSNQIMYKDLEKLRIWAYSLKEFPLGSTQIDKQGTVYTLVANMDEELRIKWFRTRNFGAESKILTQQYTDGPLIIDPISANKIQFNSRIDPNNIENQYWAKSKDLRTKAISVVTYIVTMMKCTNSLNQIKTWLNRKGIYDNYVKVIDGLNGIYTYDPHLANKLASILLDDYVLTNNHGIYTNLNDHWTTLSKSDFRARYPPKNNDVFKYRNDINSRDQGNKEIETDLEIGAYGVYLNPTLTEKQYLITGNYYPSMFLHIMDAYIHSNLPGTKERNSIFMSENRLKGLFNPSSATMPTSQEMLCIENILKKGVSAHDSYQNFMNLIEGKIIGDGLYEEGDYYSGQIYCMYTKPNIYGSVFYGGTSNFIDMNEADLKWDYVSDIGAQKFLGFIKKDLNVDFPQLGLDHNVMIGESVPELKSILSLQFYKDSFNNIHRIIPGQINTMDEIEIAPRNLMLKNQYVIPISTTESFNVDYLWYFTVLQRFSGPFEDGGRNILMGYQGRQDLEYAIDKVRKIGMVQDKGAPYISLITLASTYRNFKTALQNTDLGTVVIKTTHFNDLEYLLNNPDTYGMSLFEIISEIAFKFYTGSYFPSLTIELQILFMNVIGNSAQSIVESFGIYINSGEVKIGNNQFGKDMTQWWTNFLNSNLKIIGSQQNPWFDIQKSICVNRIELIRKFYRKLDENYTPIWVTEDLHDYWKFII